MRGCVVDPVQTSTTPNSFSSWKRWMSRTTPDADTETIQPEESCAKVQSDTSSLTEPSQSKESTETPALATQSEPSLASKPKESETRQQVWPVKEAKTVQTEKSRPSHLEVQKELSRTESVREKEKKLSDLCFIGLLWAIILVQLWMNAWLLQLLPLLILFILLKKLGKSAFID